MQSVELNPRELEAKFAMRPPPSTSHFTLPTFFSQISRSSSSHSLPASPSRPHPPFAMPLKAFPIGPRPSSATEALALERPKAMMVYEPIHEEEGEGPARKRPKVEEEERYKIGRHSYKIDPNTEETPRVVEGMRPIQVPTITSLPTIQPSGVPFLSLPLMSSTAVTQAQSILSQPLSSFLPQNFFAGVPAGGRAGARSEGASSGNSET